METGELYRQMAALTEAGTPFVLATVLDSKGSTPRGIGAKMVILPDGRIIETVGGGKIEAEIIKDGLEALKRGVSRTSEYVLRQSGENALGMACGGDMTVFLEVHTPSRTLLICGAGHISQKLCPMAKLLDMRVVVIDQRPEFATKERFEQADEVVVGSPAEVASLVHVDERTHVVIVTHGHLFDKDALRSVATTPAAYIGMIGSRSKVRTVFEELMAEGVPAEALARVKAPIGLDLGGQTPGEIAVGILAQIIADGHGKDDFDGAGTRSIAANVARGEAPEAVAAGSEAGGSGAGGSGGAACA